MSDTESPSRGVCHIYRLTGLRCQDCPKRHGTARQDGTRPLRLGEGCDYRVFVRHEKDNTGAPDSDRFRHLMRQVTGLRKLPPSSPPGRCCED